MMEKDYIINIKQVYDIMINDYKNNKIYEKYHFS